MFIVREKPPSFADVAGHVLRSVVAIAIGTTETGSPNIVGTGFACAASEFFATCWHVAEIQDSLDALDSGALRDRGLVDSTLRLGIRTEDGSHVWSQMQPKTMFRGADRAQDVCIYRMVGVSIPPLQLRPDDRWLMGQDVGIIGFPLGNALQGSSVRPFVAKTVLAGGFETETNDGEIPRVAIATAVAGGFSGAPIFSAVDGEVLGMVASKVMEVEESQWPAGISLGVVPSIIHQSFRELFGRTSTIIKESLQKTLPD
ncbi:MAG: trypsin-like peptidase domain-containing protein [Chloroflexi bacterium]|nr:trypsin-like peptidase domain-containing protein [Chloroflexota bacterium]